MDKQYDPLKTEAKIYKLWEKAEAFKPSLGGGKKPFTILLPPPNANDPLHVGHSLYMVEDVLCRWHRMRGEPVLFLPGTDHAGIETQYVFEKKLKKEGKSRFDFDRETLYKEIAKYVEENRGIAKEQLKRHGFSLDWSREKFTLEPKIIATVLETFRKLCDDGLIYRDEKMVNYCPGCGTAFSELEVDHVEQEGYLYYLDYGSVTIATTRPETIFADVAVAVNPADKRYRKLVGKTALIPLLKKEIPVIADALVEKGFGTGALKITPAHDPVDFEIGQRHKLPIIKIIDSGGRMTGLPRKYEGLKLLMAREAVVEDLEKAGYLKKTELTKHVVGICYKCKKNIEPTLMPQWFVKIGPLAKPAIEVVEKDKVKIFPKRFKKTYLQWMEKIRDWNISRQIVWGPRIPAWYCLECNKKISLSFINKEGKRINGVYEEIGKGYSFEEIRAGLQSLTAPKEANYQLGEGRCEKCHGEAILQETDTFDTWFSSGQWPLTALDFPEGEDFGNFYPTSVLDTMWDILFFWVARMIMLGIYRTGKIPFEVVHLHSRVVDKKGQKMSKSRGNVINPLEIIEKYGADALRMALVFGSSPGSDIVLSEEKIRAMRNFSNKLWNIGRFLTENLDKKDKIEMSWNWEETLLTKEDKKIVKNFEQLLVRVNGWLDRFRFDLAGEAIYQFTWHQLASEYLEISKTRIWEKDKIALQVLGEVYLNCIKLLHPFMPFVTEEIWQKIPNRENGLLINTRWPQEKRNRTGKKHD